MTRINDEVIFQKGYEKGFNDCKKEIKELQEELLNILFTYRENNKIKKIFKKRFGEMK